jgi:selenocysteine lyase/cysteine desulfurase
MINCGMQRRDFLSGSLALAGTALISPRLTANELPSPPDWDQGVTDENYWNAVRAFYTRPEGFINLENGYFSHQPASTMASHQQREKDINTRTSVFMRTEQQAAIENAREALANFLKCDTEELALLRNTTEAMNIVIMGFPWKKGDEVVLGNQDYGSMTEAFQQAAKRFGIVLKYAQVPLRPRNEEDIIDAYTRLFTRKTRMVHLTHLINLSGQVIPVAKIAVEAKKRNIAVAVDSAHAVAQLEFGIPDLQADFVGASLHKWLCNPLGSGFLWIRKEFIPQIWPLMGDTSQPANNIRKFEHVGTRPIHTLQCIADSIAFHNKIGSELKEKRLRYMMQYWTSKVAKQPKVHINTPWEDTARCGAIANVAIEGYTAGKLAEVLFSKYRIFTVAIEHPAINGIRITPHLSNTIEDLDALVNALTEISSS